MKVLVQPSAASNTQGQGLLCDCAATTLTGDNLEFTLLSLPPKNIHTQSVAECESLWAVETFVHTHTHTHTENSCCTSSSILGMHNTSLVDDDDAPHTVGCKTERRIRDSNKIYYVGAADILDSWCRAFCLCCTCRRGHSIKIIPLTFSCHAVNFFFFGKIIRTYHTCTRTLKLKQIHTLKRMEQIKWKP